MSQINSQEQLKGGFYGLFEELENYEKHAKDTQKRTDRRRALYRVFQGAVGAVCATHSRDHVQDVRNLGDLYAEVVQRTLSRHHIIRPRGVASIFGSQHQISERACSRFRDKINNSNNKSQQRKHAAKMTNAQASKMADPIESTDAGHATPAANTDDVVERDNREYEEGRTDGDFAGYNRGVIVGDAQGYKRGLEEGQVEVPGVAEADAAGWARGRVEGGLKADEAFDRGVESGDELARAELNEYIRGLEAEVELLRVQNAALAAASAPAQNIFGNGNATTNGENMTYQQLAAPPAPAPARRENLTGPASTPAQNISGNGNATTNVEKIKQRMAKRLGKFNAHMAARAQASGSSSIQVPNEDHDMPDAANDDEIAIAASDDAMGEADDDAGPNDGSGYKYAPHNKRKYTKYKEGDNPVLVKCDDCGKEVKKESLKAHQELHIEKEKKETIYCFIDKCNYTKTGRHDGLHDHMSREHFYYIATKKECLAEEAQHRAAGTKLPKGSVQGPVTALQRENWPTLKHIRRSHDQRVLVPHGNKNRQALRIYRKRIYRLRTLMTQLNPEYKDSTGLPEDAADTIDIDDNSPLDKKKSEDLYAAIREQRLAMGLDWQGKYNGLKAAVHKAERDLGMALSGIADWEDLEIATQEALNAADAALDAPHQTLDASDNTLDAAGFEADFEADEYLDPADFQDDEDDEDDEDVEDDENFMNDE